MFTPAIQNPYYKDGIFTKAAQDAMGLGYFPNSFSITGASGVGSTSAVRELLKRFDKLPYRSASAGGLMRVRAAQLGMSISQFAEHNNRHPEEGHDVWCDNMSAVFGLQDYVIMDGRLTHIAAPRAFKIKLTCPVNVRAYRRATDEGKSIADVKNALIERDNNDVERYEKLYPGSLWRPEDFDLIIDTGLTPVDEVCDIILSAHSNWKARPDIKGNLLNTLYVPHPQLDRHLLVAASV